MVSAAFVASPFQRLPGFGDAPVGAVVAFAGCVADSAAPAGSPVEALGWLVCDGRMLETAMYPELFAVLGYLYGGADGQFQLPDYRGRFLRGHDGGTAARTGSGQEAGAGQADARPASDDVNYLIKFSHGLRAPPSLRG